LDTSERGSEILGKFQNVMLEKDAKDLLDRLCKNEELLYGVKEERNILHTIKKRNAKWIGHSFRRTCLLNTLLNERYKEG